VPYRLLEIQLTPPQGHPVLTSSFQPILALTKPGVAETFKSVIDEMLYAAEFELNNSLQAENANLTQVDLNTSIDEPENRWNVHLVSYDTLTSRAKPSSNGQLSHCSWSSEIFDWSHRYKTEIRVCWRIAVTARLHVTCPGPGNTRFI